MHATDGCTSIPPEALARPANPHSILTQYAGLSWQAGLLIRIPQHPTERVGSDAPICAKSPRIRHVRFPKFPATRAQHSRLSAAPGRHAPLIPPALYFICPLETGPRNPKPAKAYTSHTPYGWRNTGRLRRSPEPLPPERRGNCSRRPSRLTPSNIDPASAAPFEGHRGKARNALGPSQHFASAAAANPPSLFLAGSKWHYGSTALISRRGGCDGRQPPVSGTRERSASKHRRRAGCDGRQPAGDVQQTVGEFEAERSPRQDDPARPAPPPQPVYSETHITPLLGASPQPLAKKLVTATRPRLPNPPRRR